MNGTIASPVARLRSVLAEQADGYRRLRDATRASARVRRGRDGDALDAALAAQVAALRELADLGCERREALRALGAGDDEWPPG
jgi:hypothetical protein